MLENIKNSSLYRLTLILFLISIIFAPIIIYYSCLMMYVGEGVDTSLNFLIHLSISCSYGIAVLIVWILILVKNKKEQTNDNKLLFVINGSIIFFCLNYCF